MQVADERSEFIKARKSPEGIVSSHIKSRSLLRLQTGGSSHSVGEEFRGAMEYRTDEHGLIVTRAASGTARGTCILGLPPRVLGDPGTDRKHAYTLSYQDRRLDQEERRKPSQNSSFIDYFLTTDVNRFWTVTTIRQQLYLRALVSRRYGNKRHHHQL